MLRTFARNILSLFVVVSVLGCAQSPAGRESLDHVVIGIADLDRGIDQLQRLTGVKPVFGGPHPDLGTHNALIGLGPEQYLELLAPRPDAPLAEHVKMLPALHELTPVAWAIQTSSAEMTIATLQRAGYETSQPRAASRTKPDGTMLRWKTFNIVSPRIPMVPFFIEWDVESRHPALDSPTGCKLDNIDVATSEPAQLELLLSIVNVSANVSMADRGAMAVSLSCEKYQKIVHPGTASGAIKHIPRLQQ